VVIDAKISVAIPVVLPLQRVAGVSAVSGHVQSVFVVELVTDLERPVLGRVPEIRRPFLYFHPQSIGLGTCQKVHRLKAEPEVGINGSKPGFVVGPVKLPVERVTKALIDDDPTEYGLDRQGMYLASERYVNSADLCNEICKTVCIYAA